MPPAHKRNFNIDDSRSETSSTVPNHKDTKNHNVPASSSGASKTNRAVNGSTTKASVNGANAAAAATVLAHAAPMVVDKDSKIPRVSYNSYLYIYQQAHSHSS